MAEPVQFTIDDFQLFERFDNVASFGQIPQADKNRFRDLRTRVGASLENAVGQHPQYAGWHTHLSILNPNGRLPKDYWAVVYAPNGDNKSFVPQIGLIVSRRGIEVCMCLGAGRAELRDPHALLRNQEYWSRMKARLRGLPPPLLTELKTAIGSEWLLREKWRLPAGASEFDTVEEWLHFAGAETTAEASISKYLSPTEAAALGAEVTTVLSEALMRFGPLLKYLDEPESARESLTARPPDSITAAKTHSPMRWWLIAPGEGGRLWDDFKRNGIAAIGWDYLGDLRGRDRDAIAEAIAEHEGSGTEPVNAGLCCYQFANEVLVGDVIIAKRGISEVLGAGFVRGNYQFQPNRSEYKHTVSVEWAKSGPWTVPPQIRLPRKALTDLSRQEAFLRFMHPLIYGGQPVSVTPPEEAPPFTIEDDLADVFLTPDQFREMLRQLSRKKNVVLQGPPGVGKTFVARYLAYARLGRKDDSRIASVVFHQSYCYEDFVAGLRPDSRGIISPQTGVFVRFCERARDDPTRDYVLIIDELNRGDLSRIFGELMVLLETEKRSERYGVILQSSEGKPFWVPPNLYVIGMMNTADRSIAFVDYALRRRFAFLSIKPAFGSPRFKDHLIGEGVAESLAEKIIEKVQSINSTIRESKDLGPGYEIGHSYFCPSGDEENLGEQWYRDVVLSEVVPLLSEYWFDQEKRVKEATGVLLE